MYCDVTDIEAYFQGKTFDSTSSVTNAKVQSFILVESAVIDSTLRKRYSLPITNTADLLILKMICERLVVGTLDDIFKERDTEGNLEKTRGARKEALEWLKKIETGKLILNSTEKTSVIKFNNTDSNSDEVEKEFAVGNIEPTGEVEDRERRSVIRVS